MAAASVYIKPRDEIFMPSVRMVVSPLPLVARHLLRHQRPQKLMAVGNSIVVVAVVDVASESFSIIDSPASRAISISLQHPTKDDDRRRWLPPRSKVDYIKG